MVLTPAQKQLRHSWCTEWLTSLRPAAACPDGAPSCRTCDSRCSPSAGRAAPPGPAGSASNNNGPLPAGQRRRRRAARSLGRELSPAADRCRAPIAAPEDLEEAGGVWSRIRRLTPTRSLPRPGRRRSGAWRPFEEVPGRRQQAASRAAAAEAEAGALAGQLRRELATCADQVLERAVGWWEGRQGCRLTG
ncbi:hypothetical protein FJT64_003558 [Amphibalanus amphitrite]|uniref:Uncharacterized protein n=1 Tax=Amphibalanus amphitrite TaxID=1232801 RepID=A0A6A4WB93_AMPAM|nr:hypothetical protein FJT64_003558 [Amphibalanus amphitrite]